LDLSETPKEKPRASQNTPPCFRLEIIGFHLETF